MSVTNFKWIRKIVANEESKASLVRVIKRDLKLYPLVLCNDQLISDLRSAPSGSSLEKLMQSRPETAGMVFWPYQCAAWNVKTRLNHIKNHCSVLDKMAEPLNMPVDARLILLDLEELTPGLKLVIDQPKWLAKEGLMSINIFLGNFRAFSLSFSFLENDHGSIDCYIGGLQGRKRENILETYKMLTKLLYGLRPRDFLIEIFRSLCCNLKINAIYAVADEYRSHRHPYFAKTDFHMNYDDVWKERGGVRESGYFYKIEVAPARKDLADIKSKKRAMYKKRFELLDDLDARINTGFESLTPVYFEDC